MGNPVARGPWKRLAKNMAGQGAEHVGPVSPNGRYWACLAKVENAGGETSPPAYYVMFEVVNEGWMQNVVFSRSFTIKSAPPPFPVLLYEIPRVDEAVILRALGLSTADDLAEGSWYLVTLLPQEKAEEGIAGLLSDPDFFPTEEPPLGSGREAP